MASRIGHVVVGTVLLAWPVTETLIFGYPMPGESVWLRPAVAGMGVAILTLGLWLRRLNRVGLAADPEGQ